MNELIPIYQSTIGGKTIQTANAREIYAYLEVRGDFSDWIKRRIDSYGFVQDVDFVKFLKSEAGTISPIEYHVTLDMAKQLAMVERTKKGKEVRLYFIDCERRALAIVPVPSISTAHDRLAVLKACVSSLESLGILDDRDKIEFGAYIRQVAKTEMQPLMTGGSAQPALAAPTLWTLSMRLQALGYPPLTGEESASIQIRLGTAIVKAYRQTYGEAPKKIWDYVKGQQREVNAYPPERLGVVDEVITSMLGVVVRKE